MESMRIRGDNSEETGRVPLMNYRKPGFFYGYVMVVIGFSIQFLSWGINNSFGVFYHPFINEFGWHRAVISGAVSLSYLLHGFISIFLGSLNDRFGPRLIITACGFILGLGFLMMSGLKAVWQLYLFYGVIVGFGLSAMDLIPLSTVARWFEKKRGIMSGVVKMGTGLGMVVMPIFVTWLITTYSWRRAFTVLGLLIMAVIVSLAQFLVRDPAKKGQWADNNRGPVPGGLNLQEGGLSYGETIRTRQFWTICVVYFIILFCAYTIVLHIVQHAIDLGISASNAAHVLSAIGAVSIVGRFVMGGAGDRIGHKSALIICLLFLSIALTWLQFAKELWMLYLFSIIYGFAHGGFFALVSPVAAGLFGTRAHGVILGNIIFSSTIGGAIGPVLAGHVFDVTRSYQIVFIILVILSIIGLLFTLSLKPIHQKA